MLQNAIQDLRTAIVALIAFTLLTGLAYPYAITGIAQVAFHRQANGSFVEQNGQTVGSSLVGQNFSGAAYFHPRPSAAGVDGYDASASSGSNLGPSSQVLADRVSAGVVDVREDEGLAPDGRVPVDAVTTSASGLDPHISPAYAELQVARVARERSATESDLRQVVERYTDGATFGVLGEPRVNVLKLNLALDTMFGRAR
jgi:K+-transporting ATPase ATPase C chain